MKVDYEILTDGLEFPEGPVACVDGSVLVVEVAAERITRVLPDGRKEIVARTGGGPNGLAFGPDGALYCCNNGGAVWGMANGFKVPIAPLPSYVSGSIQKINVATGKVETLYTRCDDHKLAAPNDIVFDNKGGFWFTDLGRYEGEMYQTGGVYYARADGSFIRRIATGDHYNGVGLSPDGKTVYAASTMFRWIFAFDADPQLNPVGNVYSARIVADFRKRCLLDSMAVEADGTIAQACVFDNAGIARVNPATGATETVPFDDPIVTNIAFGGKDMKTAYVTRSASGTLARAKWPTPGLVLAYNF